MSRQTRYGVVLLLLLAAVLRLWWWHVGPKVIENEGTNYARLGENLAAGRGLIGLDGNLQLIYPPLIPGLIAAGVRTGLTSETAGRLVSFLFGIWTPVLLMLLGRRLYGPTAGWLAGVLGAVHPLLIVASTAVLPESAYLTLALWVLLAAIGVLSRDSKRAAIAMGLGAGLAFLCRPEGLVLLVALGVAMVLMDGRRRVVTATRVGTAFAVFAIFAAPWVVFLWHETGHLSFETKGSSALIEQLGAERGESWQYLTWGLDSKLNEVGMGNSSDLDQWHLSEAESRSISLPHRLKLFVKQAKNNVPSLLRGLGSAELGQPMLAILVGLGLFGTAWSRARLRDELPFLVLVALSTTFYLMWPWILDRYLFIYMGPGLIWAGLGLDRLWSWARETADHLGAPALPALTLKTGVSMSAAALVVAMSAVGVRNADELSQSWQPERTDQLAIGRWLRSQQSGARVMDSFSAAAFYSGAVLADLPWADGPTAVQYLERKQPSFVIVHQSQVNARSYLQDWFDRIPDEHLTLAETFQDAGGQVRVYRWLGHDQLAQRP